MAEHAHDALPAWGPDDVGQAITETLARMSTLASAAGYPTPQLVAVAKTKPVSLIEGALAVGQREFGENRVQEAEAKYPALRDAHPDLVLHLIGPLQTNKVKLAVQLFDVIQTVDRPKLARALADARDAVGHCPRLMIQVNTGEEPQKAGVLPAETEAFVAHCRDELDLPVEGLMCIPPVDEEPALHFGLLAELAERVDLPHRSMGMSADWETAVRMGATHIRIGSALFGAR